MLPCTSRAIAAQTELLATFISVLRKGWEDTSGEKGDFVACGPIQRVGKTGKGRHNRSGNRFIIQKEMNSEGLRNKVSQIHKLPSDLVSHTVDSCSPNHIKFDMRERKPLARTD